MTAEISEFIESESMINAKEKKTAIKAEKKPGNKEVLTKINELKT